MVPAVFVVDCTPHSSAGEAYGRQSAHHGFGDDLFRFRCKPDIVH